MLISHKHRFIFIKTNKTAGTSVEIALSRQMDPADVITPISQRDEVVRREQGGLGPRNYLAPPWDYRRHDLRVLLGQGRLKKRFYNHIGATEIRRHVDDRVWTGYFKFCIERNPWDRVVSHYYWVCRSEPRPTLREYLASRLPLALKKHGRELYAPGGKPVVDHVCRMEDLDAELAAIQRRLNLPEPLVLPRVKSGHRVDKRSYRELLGPEERDIIARLFKDEIDQMGYQF